MSTSDLTKFVGGSQDKGINTFDPDIGGEITWDESTVNVTGGARKGVGPRYGMAPLPGHSNTETPAGTACNGIMKSEASSGGTGLVNRELHFAIHPITIGSYADVTAKEQFYAHIFSVDGYIDSSLNSIYSSSVYQHASDFSKGLSKSSWSADGTLLRRYKTEFIKLPLSAAVSDMQPFFSIPSGRKWISTASLKVSGKDVKYRYLLGKVTAVPTATTLPSINLWDTTGLTSAGTVYLGCPSSLNTGKYSKETRLVSMIPYDANGASLSMGFRGTIAPASIFSAQLNYATGAHIATAGATSVTKTGAGVTYSSAVVAIYDDPAMTGNSEYQAILVAGVKPMAMIIQPWVRQTDGLMQQWCDLSNPGPAPRKSANFVYDVDGASLMPSSWYSASSTHIQEGGAGTGVLEAGITYQLAFSYYNKRLDYETNVGEHFNFKPVANLTGIYLYDTDAVSGTMYSRMRTGNSAPIPWEFGSSATAMGHDPRHMAINDYEVRFYYRPYGQAEWLPAGSFDLAGFWFRGYNGKYYICQNPIGSLPGGQPNGFIDYSPLPDKKYDCVLTYKNRVWWFSEDSINFSSEKSIFYYPTRNSIPAQTGKYRGGTLHVQLGQTEQSARLVIWGSDQSYVARFTGELMQQSVRVSSETVATFPVDASDLVIDFLSDATAFSFRSAVIADGYLYFWGHSGVYFDDGTDNPKKISAKLEPEIFSYVDTSLIEDINAIYNKPTKEIYWFYQPKTADATYPTYALVLNVVNGNFYTSKFKFYVDSAQVVKIENDDSPEGLAGERIILNVRKSGETVSRPFFFDNLCSGGDMGPGKEMLVKTVSTPSTGQRRLTFAAGHTDLTNISVNDYVCLAGVKKYDSSLTNGDDMIAKVMAVSSGSSYIDILLPDNAAFDASASPAYYEYFPVYHGGLLTAASPGIHGIPYQLKTNYWLPAGITEAWYWRYLYFLFKYIGIPTPTDIYTKLPMGARIGLQYRTPVSGAYVSDTLKLTNNSDGHAQIHHPLRNVDRSANGQALKYLLSGVHIGNPWTLEYLEAHCSSEDGFTLKEFEG